MKYSNRTVTLIQQSCISDTLKVRVITAYAVKKSKQTSILELLFLKKEVGLSDKKIVKQVSGSYSQWYYNIAVWIIPTLA